MLSKTLLLHEELELNIDLAHMLDFFCHWRPAQGRVHDAAVDQLIGKLQEQHTSFEVADRAAASGDQLKIDFIGNLDGERVESACGENFTFKVGEGQMIEDFYMADQSSMSRKGRGVHEG